MSDASSSPAFRQPTAIERLFNRVFGFLVGGLGFKHNYLLQVRGRKSGKLYSTPIDLLEIDGRRYLVAPRGQTQWVRNAEAAGEIVLKKGSDLQSFGLRPIANADKPPLLKGLPGEIQSRSTTLLPDRSGLRRGGLRRNRRGLSGVRTAGEEVVGG